MAHIAIGACCDNAMPPILLNAGGHFEVRVFGEGGGDGDHPQAGEGGAYPSPRPSG